MAFSIRRLAVPNTFPRSPATTSNDVDCEAGAGGCAFGVFAGGAGIGGAAVGRAPSLPGGAGTAFVGAGGREDGSVIVALATRRPVGTTDTRGPAGVAVGFEVAVGVELDVDVEASEPTDQPAENSSLVPSTENEDAVGTVISGDAVPVNRRRMDPTPP